MALDAAGCRALLAALAEEDPFCPPPPEGADAWPEARIRAFFDAGGVDAGGAQAAAPAEAPLLTQAQVLAKFPPPSVDEFARWFPGLERSKTKCAAPRMRLLCFTNAGNEENIFTNEGLGARRVAVLLEWCRANGVELLAPQLPGRGLRSKEPFLRDAQTVASHVVRVAASRLADTPYCVIGHSVGTWIAYETLALMREQGLPMPLQVFFSCFPAPDLPPAERPWRAQRGLDDTAFKAECREWDVSEALFADAALWAQYVALLRADFSLFDEYEHRHAGEPPFAFPITAFHAHKDRKVSPALVARWAGVTRGAFRASGIEGHHLFVMGVGEQRAAKEQWLAAVVAELRQLQV